MGRKHCHQIFVVARVVPDGSTDDQPLYRCIAAYNHKWCYGRLPLKATRRFLTLAKHSGNAEIIRAELANLHKSFGRYKCTPSPPDLACPYISFLLGTSSSVDLEDPNEAYGSGVDFLEGVLSCDTTPLRSDEKVDSDGITVIDLTDPSNPAYCFMLPPNIDIPRVPVPSGVPLSASEYLRVYYPIPNSKDLEHAGVYEFEDLTRSTIDALQGERIVTLDMLAEAWPDEYEAKLEESRKTGKGGEDVAVAANPGILIPSLVEMTLKPALRHSLEIGDTYDLEELVWMPGRGGAIKSLLRYQNPFPDTGLALLIKIIETEPTSDEVALNLRGFQLSAKQTLAVLSEVERAVEVLNLSDNHIITADDIKHILLAFPSIRRLFLLGTSISTEDLNKLLTDEPELFFSIEAIIHPAFLQQPGDERASYPNAFAFVGLQSKPKLFTLSLPFFTPSSIIQCLTDFLAGFTVRKFATYGLAKSTLVPQSAFASLRDEDEKWSERLVPLVPQGLTSPVLSQGRGWAFVFDCSMPAGDAPKPKKYAFVKLETHYGFTLHHFQSFLDELAREGRRTPSSMAVDRLNEIFKRLGASLMTDDDVGPFLMGTNADLSV